MSSLPPPHPMPPIPSDDGGMARGSMTTGAIGMLLGPFLSWRTPDDPVELGLGTSAGQFLVFLVVPAIALAVLVRRPDHHIAVEALGALVGIVAVGWLLVQIIDVMTAGSPIHGENAAGKGLYVAQLSAGWYTVGACIGLGGRVFARPPNRSTAEESTAQNSTAQK